MYHTIQFNNNGNQLPGCRLFPAMVYIYISSIYLFIHVDYRALFPVQALVNHSCTPNLQYIEKVSTKSLVQTQICKFHKPSTNTNVRNSQALSTNTNV